MDREWIAFMVASAGWAAFCSLGLSLPVFQEYPFALFMLWIAGMWRIIWLTGTA